MHCVSVVSAADRRSLRRNIIPYLVYRSPARTKMPNTEFAKTRILHGIVFVAYLQHTQVTRRAVFELTLHEERSICNALPL